MSSWIIEEVSGPAHELHQRELPDPSRPTVWVASVDGPTLVLGSTMALASIDAEAAGQAGIEVVRRRSGGGAVLVKPGELTWIDVFLPAGHPQWQDDVGRSFLWLGEVWRSVVVRHWPIAAVNRGPMRRNEWSPRVCFAGLGPGEVTTATDGPKLVGMSQRRTRTVARFQCAVYHRWDAAETASLLVMDDADRQRCVAELTPAVASWPGDPADLVTRFLDALTG